MKNNLKVLWLKDDNSFTVFGPDGEKVKISYESCEVRKETIKRILVEFHVKDLVRLMVQSKQPFALNDSPVYSFSGDGDRSININLNTIRHFDEWLLERIQKIVPNFDTKHYRICAGVGNEYGHSPDVVCVVCPYHPYDGKFIEIESYLSDQMWLNPTVEKSDSIYFEGLPTFSEADAHQAKVWGEDDDSVDFDKAVKKIGG